MESCLQILPFFAASPQSKLVQLLSCCFPQFWQKGFSSQGIFQLLSQRAGPAKHNNCLGFSLQLARIIQRQAFSHAKWAYRAKKKKTKCKKKGKSCQVFWLGCVFFLLPLCIFASVYICPFFFSQFPSLLNLFYSPPLHIILCLLYLLALFPVELPALSSPLALFFPLRGLIMRRHEIKTFLSPPPQKRSSLRAFCGQLELLILPSLLFILSVSFSTEWPFTWSLRLWLAYSRTPIGQ